tara:strand:+ start:659 stop:1177 length:519 start_codon:yes stop_codon:yes gene_type:complete
VISAPPQVEVVETLSREEATARMKGVEVEFRGAAVPMFGRDYSGPPPEDLKYAVVAEDSVRGLAWWCQRVTRGLKAQGYQSRSNNRDCDDRADLIQALRQFIDTGDSSLFLVKLTFSYPRGALGVEGRPGSTHQLLGVLADTGWYAIEVSDGQYCRLADFPNRDGALYYQLH